MKSRWFEYKDKALLMRQDGRSLRYIEKELGIPRSTLSGWFKDIELTTDQYVLLSDAKKDGWAKARKSAAIIHRQNKLDRISLAESQAKDIFEGLPGGSNEVLELALAMLYFGEGGKNYTTTLGSSDPFMINFFLSALEKLYGLDRNKLRYELHLRYDHDTESLKRFWSVNLRVKISCFNYVSVDKRTVDKPTKSGYMGVCQVQVGNIWIQRRLKALYGVYCTDVISGT